MDGVWECPVTLVVRFCVVGWVEDRSAADCVTLMVVDAMASVVLVSSALETELPSSVVPTDSCVVFVVLDGYVVDSDDTVVALDGVVVAAVVAPVVLPDPEVAG